MREPGTARAPQPPRVPEPVLSLTGRPVPGGINEIGGADAAPAFAQPAGIITDVLSAPAEAGPAPAGEPAPDQAAEPSEIEQPGRAEPSGLASSLDAVIADEAAGEDSLAEVPAELPPPEVVGGDSDAAEESRERRAPPRFSRNYKIQEVIKRRQILLVQVVKEERGNKGAALTTYLSLAGRYCVLMPNTNRGGGVSRKITSIADRRRLKDILEDLEIPEGMGVIVRTAAEGESALASFKEWSPDLLITDLYMPHMDGVELCRRIRESSAVPITPSGPALLFSRPPWWASPSGFWRRRSTAPRSAWRSSTPTASTCGSIPRCAGCSAVRPPSCSATATRSSRTRTTASPTSTDTATPTATATPTRMCRPIVPRSITSWWSLANLR